MTSNPKVVGSFPTLVRVFLCPCVGPVPSVGLTLTWFIWDRNLALHVTLHSRQLILFQILKGSVIELLKNDCTFVNTSVRTPIGVTWLYTVWSSVSEVLSWSLIERNKRV